MTFPKKNSVFGQLSSLTPRPTPLKSAHFIFIVVWQSPTQAGDQISNFRKVSKQIVTEMFFWGKINSDNKNVCM